MQGKAKGIKGKLYIFERRPSPMNAVPDQIEFHQDNHEDMTYGSAVWGYIAQSYLKKLETTENVFLRAATNATLRGMLGTPNYDENRSGNILKN